MVREAQAFEVAPIETIAWSPPPGWLAPDWLAPEPEPASLPMQKDRFRWCLHAIGWSLEELARRIHTHESSIRQMGRGRRDIPDTLAMWLELQAARTLSGPLVPDGWRAKPVAIPEEAELW